MSSFNSRMKGLRKLALEAIKKKDNICGSPEDMLKLLDVVEAARSHIDDIDGCGEKALIKALEALDD